MGHPGVSRARQVESCPRTDKTILIGKVVLLLAACVFCGALRCYAQTTASLHVTILDENKKPLKQQALVRLTNLGTNMVLFESTRGSQANFADLPAGRYLLEAGAAGYIGVHQQMNVTDLGHAMDETVTLSRDPAAVDLSLNNAEQIPSKARKQAEKGLQSLILSNFVDARKHLEAANRDYPSSSSINFLLGYLALQQKDADKELSYLEAAVKFDPKNVQAQNLLGQIYYKHGDYARAAAAEEVAVASSPNSVIARKVLANSCLMLKQYDKARENAQWLVDQGGTEGASARLTLGQAQAGLQQYEDAIHTLTTYLNETPSNAATPKVRELIAQLKDAAKGAAQSRPSAQSGIADPELAADSDSAGAFAGMPPDIDTQKPAVATGVPCPANVLAATANPSIELVDSIARFSAVEHMVHENISPQGTPRNRESRQFNYVASINEPKQGMLTVHEYRDAGELEMPDKINTTGLAVLAIAFHPAFRDSFDMTCEGLGEWNGQPAWLVHFRQADNKPSLLRGYMVGGFNYPVRLKGRAWFRTDDFQMLHLETDLVRSIPEIRLMTEHTSVNYGPVQFKRSGVDLWLPQSADLYVDMGKRRFHRSESFDHFMLFATDATETPKSPKEAVDAPKSPDSAPATVNRGSGLR